MLKNMYVLFKLVLKNNIFDIVIGIIRIIIIVVKILIFKLIVDNILKINKLVIKLRIRYFIKLFCCCIL